MLEKFRIKDEDTVLVKHGFLQTTVASIFNKLGVNPEDSESGSEVLVEADLRGVDSHGVSNQLRSYVKGYQEGRINPTPNWRIIRESPSTATIDCDGGLGIILTPKAMDLAIQKAKITGVGMVTMRNSRHLGMAAYHAMRALKYDFIGLCMSATGTPLVLPTYGQEAMLGTNPISIAIPAGKEHPFVLDMATSSIAANKIQLAKRLGIELSGGWIAEPNGNPIMDKIPAQEIGTGPGGTGYPPVLLPLGSSREMGSHKGYGLGCMVEILCGILSGGGFSLLGDRDHYKHMVAAYDIEAFSPLQEFKETMDEFLHSLKSSKPAEGQTRVMVPGQPEFEEKTERLSKGIPLHIEVITWFRKTCSELEVECLF
jgi:L-2-hydroxycarboxylate dehydrogenase (NAD+)